MIESKLYTTQLQAGLGLVDETKSLLELWSPDMSTNDLFEIALQSGLFPTVSARRLRNIVAECFAPRYLTGGGDAAVYLKKLEPKLSSPDLAQLMLVFTCRANPILADFIRDVYWPRYAGGYTVLTNEDARIFVERSIDDGKTVKRWSESTVKKVSSYLIGCCADYSLLERGRRSDRRIISFRISAVTAAYFAHKLHFGGVGDNALLNNQFGRFLVYLRRMCLRNSSDFLYRACSLSRQLAI